MLWDPPGNIFSSGWTSPFLLLLLTGQVLQFPTILVVLMVKLKDCFTSEQVVIIRITECLGDHDCWGTWYWLVFKNTSMSWMPNWCWDEGDWVGFTLENIMTSEDWTMLAHLLRKEWSIGNSLLNPVYKIKNMDVSWQSLRCLSLVQHATCHRGYLAIPPISEDKPCASSKPNWTKDPRIG